MRCRVRLGLVLWVGRACFGSSSSNTCCSRKRGGDVVGWATWCVGVVVTRTQVWYCALDYIRMYYYSGVERDAYMDVMD